MACACLAYPIRNIFNITGSSIVSFTSDAFTDNIFAILQPSRVDDRLAANIRTRSDHPHFSCPNDESLIARNFDKSGFCFLRLIYPTFRCLTR